MKPYKKWNKIGSLIYQVRVLGLVLLMVGLVRCECQKSSGSSSPTAKIPPAPNKPLETDTSDTGQTKPLNTDTSKDGGKTDTPDTEGNESLNTDDPNAGSNTHTPDTEANKLLNTGATNDGGKTDIPDIEGNKPAGTDSPDTGKRKLLNTSTTKAGSKKDTHPNTGENNLLNTDTTKDGSKTGKTSMPDVEGNKPLETDIPDTGENNLLNTDATKAEGNMNASGMGENKPSETQKEKPITTPDMLALIEESSLNPEDKASLQKVLTLFQDTPASGQAEKVPLDTYISALRSVLDLEDLLKAQASVKPKAQIEKAITAIIQTLVTNKEVVLRALLKSEAKANGIFMDTFNKAWSNLHKPNNKSKAILFAVLDPEIIKQQTKKPVINDGILNAAIHYPTEDLLQKLFESTLTIKLTDKEITGLIRPFENYANRAAILKTLLKGLIQLKGQPSIKQLLGKKNDRRIKLVTKNPITNEWITDPLSKESIIEVIVSKQPTYKPIFIELGLMEATEITDNETDENEEVDSDFE